MYKTLNQMFKSQEIIERKVGGQTLQWPNDKGQTMQWPNDKGQAMQWPNDKGQTMQWRNEKNSKHSEKHYSSYHTTQGKNPIFRHIKSNNSGMEKVKIVKNERDPPLFTSKQLIQL